MVNVRTTTTTTRNFWKFCNTFIPVPETFGSSGRLPYPYPESTNPTERNIVIFVLYTTAVSPLSKKYTYCCRTWSMNKTRDARRNVTGLCSVAYVQTAPGYYADYYPTKNSYKFCRTFIPVAGTSGSSGRLPYPYPELQEVLYTRGHNAWGTCTAFDTRSELL